MKSRIDEQFKNQMLCALRDQLQQACPVQVKYSVCINDMSNQLGNVQLSHGQSGTSLRITMTDEQALVQGFCLRKPIKVGYALSDPNWIEQVLMLVASIPH